MENFHAASKSAKALTTDREVQLRKALDNFSSAADKMDKLTGRLDSLRATIQSVTTKVDKGHGTLGKLVNDEKVYDELKSAVTELKLLIADVKANPKKYLTVKIF